MAKDKVWYIEGNLNNSNYTVSIKVAEVKSIKADKINVRDGRFGLFSIFKYEIDKYPCLGNWYTSEKLAKEAILRWQKLEQKNIEKRLVSIKKAIKDSKVSLKCKDK